MRLLLCALAGTVFAVPPLHAQSLTEAFNAAWRRSPAGVAATARGDEAAALRETARRWVRDSPQVGAAYKTDQVDKNAGAREIELEVGVPVALPYQRAASIAVGNGEAAVIEAQRAVARLALAHDVRESYWTSRIAQVDLEVAQRRLEEATQLADDVSRRVKAGEAPRLDANQATAARLTARSAVAAAQVAVQRSVAAFTQLTGLSLLPARGEAPATAAPRDVDHPLVALAQATADAARARAELASRVRSDAPEFFMVLTRARGDVTETFGNTVRVGVKIPLGSDARNRVRIAQTDAERAEAEAALVAEAQRRRTEIALARDELAAAQDAALAAEERARLAADTQSLIDRAYRLGERDLMQRLRASTERFEAELAAARAQADVGRAISRLNQALGVLP